MQNLTVTAVGGVPCSGKTTLMKAVLAQLQKQARATGNLGYDFKSGLVVGREFPEAGVFVLGDYTNLATPFAGTDRLSMAVQPQVLRFVIDLHKESEAHRVPRHVLFEGDRLFNVSLFAALQTAGVHFRIFVLSVPPDVQEHRFVGRGARQPDSFLKGRNTKIANVALNFRRQLTYLPNATDKDLHENRDRILQL